MKKLSFLMALVLVFSSILVVPVAAATEYSYAGDTNATNTFAQYTSSGTTTTTGLTAQYNVVGPQKASSDTVYHVYGTSTLDNSEWWKYSFNKALKSDTDFNDKTNYSYSIDVYFPTTSDADTKSEIVVQAGISIFTLNCVFKTGSYAEGDPDYGASSAVFYGLEKDKWYNITIDYSYDSTTKTLVRNVYINGALASEYYLGTSMTYKTGGTITNTNANITATTWYMVARPTLKFVTDEKHDFYFDNVKYRASAFTPDTTATISTAVDDVVTVEDTITLDGIKALVTGANTVEVYRANAEATTGYDAVTENFATGDIVKLITTNGSYSYYTLNVTATEEPEEPENPFTIGDLTSDLDVSDGSVSATLVLSGDTADKDVTLVVCLYKGITLVEMVSDTILSGDAVKNLSKSITVPTEAGNYTAKAFVWDSLNSMNMLK